MNPDYFISIEVGGVKCFIPMWGGLIDIMPADLAPVAVSQNSVDDPGQVVK